MYARMNVSKYYSTLGTHRLKVCPFNLRVKALKNRKTNYFSERMLMASNSKSSIFHFSSALHTLIQNHNTLFSMVGRVTTFKNWSLYHLGNSCETEVHVWIAKHAFEILASNQPTKQTLASSALLVMLACSFVVLRTSSGRPASRDRIHIVGEGLIYVRHFVYIMHVDDNNKTKKHPFLTEVKGGDWLSFSSCFFFFLLVNTFTKKRMTNNFAFHSDEMGKRRRGPWLRGKSCQRPF